MMVIARERNMGSGGLTTEEDLAGEGEGVDMR
jgi:hypothetical protein